MILTFIHWLGPTLFTVVFRRHASNLEWEACWRSLRKKTRRRQWGLNLRSIQNMHETRNNGPRFSCNALFYGCTMSYLLSGKYKDTLIRESCGVDRWTYGLVSNCVYVLLIYYCSWPTLLRSQLKPNVEMWSRYNLDLRESMVKFM